MQDLTVTTPTATTPNETFLFYASNLDVMEQFPEDERRKLARTIIEYGCTGKVDCSPQEHILLEDIFKAIDDQKQRYRDVQFVEYYIKKIKTYQFNTERVSISESDRKDALKRLKMLRERVRREHITSLENVIVEVLQYPLSDLLQAKQKTLGDRFTLAMATASIEQRRELQKSRDTIEDAVSYLLKYESEHLN